MATSDDNLPLDLRDWRHAARMFTDASQQFAPKFKFLYHVFFGINQSALANPALVGVYRNEIGLLVKNTGLPSFDVKTETVNQYNRKRNIQTHMTYKPISIKFHEDNAGLINQLWQNYYQYFFADSATAQSGGAYAKNATKKASGALYGLNGKEAPFFNYVTISVLSQKKYVSYKLINPIISSWTYEAMDYSKAGETAENTMQLNYEAVVFSSGDVAPGSPEGFGTVHYDTGPSPNAKLVPAKQSAPAPVASSAISNPGNTAQTINNYLNNPGGGISGAPTGIGNTASTAGGLQGFSFPR